MLARSLNLIKQTNSRIVDVLNRDSEVLERVQDSFFTMIRSRDQEKLPPIEITCFFEELPLPGIGLVSKATLLQPVANSKVIRSFHVNLPRCQATFQSRYIKTT